MTPLQFGLPGGPELLIVILLLLSLLLVPIIVFVVVYRLVARRTNYEERVSRLEREVADLRQTVEEGEDGESSAEPDEDVEDPEPEPLWDDRE
jgi:sec-independent protein translocase protein TatA